jgi:long-chain acyl-CoA synthetase
MVPSHSLQAYTFKQAMALGKEKKHTPVPCELDDIAVLQYTGGTTGLSKGAMLTQKNILANMAQIRHVAHGNILEGQETVLTAIPLYHIFALTVNFLTFLALGERMILVPKPIPISNTVGMFKKYKITVLTGVNTLYNALNNDKEFQALAPKTIKFALAGGASLQDSVNKAWQKITGIRIVEGFGLTEASPVTHVNPLDTPARVASIGVPTVETNARIVDPEGNDVPLGEVGELIVSGPQVMLGYWMREDETKKSIRNGWLWTGDMARMDADGFFYIVDRKKDMILVSGFNVYPNEVEGVLASHPKVLEAAVVGVPDGASGESVKAFVVAKDKSLTVEELRDHCRDQLTGYKRPRHFELRDSLPKTNIGKILRRELRDDVSNPAST